MEELIIKQAESLKLEMEKHKDYLLNVENCKTMSELNKLVGRNMRRLVMKDITHIDMYTKEDILNEAKSIAYREYYKNINQLNIFYDTIRESGRLGLIMDCVTFYEGFNYEIFTSALETIISDTKKLINKER